MTHSADVDMILEVEEQKVEVSSITCNELRLMDNELVVTLIVKIDGREHIRRAFVKSIYLGGAQNG